MELDEGYIDIICTVFICTDRSFVKEKLEGFPRGEGPPREKCSLVELLQILISLKLFQDKQLIKSFEKEKGKRITKNFLGTVTNFYCKRTTYLSVDKDTSLNKRLRMSCL